MGYDIGSISLMRRNLGLFEFASQQDPDVFQNLGKIDYKDERYAEFIMPQKSMSLPTLSKSSRRF